MQELITDPKALFTCVLVLFGAAVVARQVLGIAVTGLAVGLFAWWMWDTGAVVEALNRLPL